MRVCGIASSSKAARRVWRQCRDVSRCAKRVSMAGLTPADRYPVTLVARRHDVHRCRHVRQAHSPAPTPPELHCFHQRRDHLRPIRRWAHLTPTHTRQGVAHTPACPQILGYFSLSDGPSTGQALRLARYCRSLANCGLDTCEHLSAFLRRQSSAEDTAAGPLTDEEQSQVVQVSRATVGAVGR